MFIYKGFDRDMISSIGWTTQLRALVTHSTCKIISNGSFVLHSSEMISSFLIKTSRLKAIEIEIAFFNSLGIPRVVRWIISFMLHISVITSPTNWYLYQWVSWNISEDINKKNTSAFNYWDDFTTCCQILKKDWGHCENLGECGGQAFKGSDREQCQF